jgi:hypothetical protein
MRNPLYGCHAWDKLQPGESMLVPAGYRGVVTYAKNRTGAILTSTNKNAPEGYVRITCIAQGEA